MHPDWHWIVPFTIIDSFNRIFYGMFSTLMGPSLPYLANSVSVDIDTINWLNPFASFAALFGAILSSMIFKKYFKSSCQKLTYLIVCTIICGISSLLPIYTKSFFWLIFAASLRQFTGQMLEVPCQGLYVYTLGAKRSQPFVMLFHCTVGIGFMLGPILIRPFFPQQTLNQRNEMCSSQNLMLIGAHNRSSSSDSLESIIETIKWPYWIVFYGHIVCAVGYFAVMLSPFKMPVDEAQLMDLEDADQKKKRSKESFLRCSCPDDKWILLTIVMLYMAGCGTERLFQGLQFTFGLCGPLKLPASEAVLTDEFYNGGFFAGRMVSIVAVKFMSPKFMLKFCIMLCAISSILLSMEADRSASLLYICAGLYGFAISWQYGSAFSWSAQFMDVVGTRASVFNLGCSLSFVAPLSGGYLFHRWTPMAMWHLNLIFVSVQIMAFVCLHFMFKKAGEDQKGSATKEYSYRELTQLEEINLSSSEED